MAWPAPDEFSEAVQNPQINLRDPDLRSGSVEINSLGLPVVSSGAFASVYRFTTPRGLFALRCFLAEIKDRKDRYLEISRFIHRDSLSATVDFEFLEEGIRIGKDWYPALKMEWVEGCLLNNWVNQNISDSNKIDAMAESFRQMILSLRNSGISHGDLQHGNILVHADQLRLVDYDGMFVPALAGQLSNELGHPNYQHPHRLPEHYGLYMDNFSSWVIYITLRCLAIDPSLWDRNSGCGDERLLLSRRDFLAPETSSMLLKLRNHNEERICSFGELVTNLLRMDPSEIPCLDQESEDQPIAPIFQRIINQFGLRVRNLFGRAWKTRPSIESTTAVSTSERLPGKWYDHWLGTPSFEAAEQAVKQAHVSATVSQHATSSAELWLQSSLIPEPSEWNRWSYSRRRKEATEYDFQKLLDAIECYWFKHFEVVLQMISLRSNESISQARSACFALSKSIPKIPPGSRDLLPEMQSTFEAALNASDQLGGTSQDIDDCYFATLQALLLHKAEGAPVDSYSIIRTWSRIDHSTNTAEQLALQLLDFISEGNQDLAIQSAGTLIVLLEVYADKKTVRRDLLQLYELITSGLDRKITELRSRAVKDTIKRVLTTLQHKQESWSNCR